MKNKRRYLKAPIRPKLDADLEHELANYLSTHPEHTQADVVRLGVRIVLGITTHRERVVQEKNIAMPSRFIANLKGRDLREGIHARKTL